MCECGAEVYILKTQECRKCYKARWDSENKDKRNSYDRSVYVPKPIVYTVTMAPTTPCSYSAAHLRVRYYRGLPSQRVCECGAQAQEWSYRGNSSYEQVGPRRKRYDSGRWETVTSTWSTHIKDYDALCKPCHVYRDRWEPKLEAERQEQAEAEAQLPSVPHVERPQLDSFESTREVPGVPPQVISPMAGRDSE